MNKPTIRDKSEELNKRRIEDLEKEFTSTSSLSESVGAVRAVGKLKRSNDKYAVGPK